MGETAQELAKSSDNMFRFWLALCALAFVLGGNQAAMMLTQRNNQNDIQALEAIASELAVTANATAVQTQTYQEGARARALRIERDVERMSGLLNELMRRQNN